MMRSTTIAIMALGSVLALTACPGGKNADPKPVADKQPDKVAQPKTATATAQAANAQPPAMDPGKQLYLTGCANCHGPDGSGAMMRQMMPNIGDLTSPETHKRLSDDDIATRIAKGKDKMPPFDSVFKPDQIKQIVAYVRTLKKG